MATNEPIPYFEDKSQWGNYQYIKLVDLIDNFMMSRDDDDYTSTSHRYQVLFQARKGIRELYYDVLREIKGVSMELPPTLTMHLPPDFVNYVRISWVDDEGYLHPMAVNNKISMAAGYLQDNQFRVLLDKDGCALMDYSIEAGSTDSGAVNSDPNSKVEVTEYLFCNDNFKPNSDRSNHYPRGGYRIDKDSGIIQFDSNISGKSVVLEYISDGLYTGCNGKSESEIRIHKFAEAALLDFIYYELIKNRRNVPFNEKQRARKEFYNSKRKAKRRMSTLRKDELTQLFKGDTVWIKGN